MPLSQQLLHSVTSGTPKESWAAVTNHLWAEFSQPIPAPVADAEVVKRERDLTELENVIAGSAWDMWEDFETSVPKASQSIVEFWKNTHGGKAVLILDGLSLREVPFLQEEATKRGHKIHRAAARAAELPAETTPFANALGFGQRSSLESNGAGAAHKLTGAGTESSDLNWKDCIEHVGNHEGFVFWHHWPDHRLHDLAKPGEGLHKLAREIHTAMTSEDFWQFVERLATGRRLVITSDHGYAACGHFPDLIDKDQVAYMKKLFKNGRTAVSATEDGAWVPPIDLRLTTCHDTYQYVLGRRKWKSPSGYPTMHHGGLSLLEESRRRRENRRPAHGRGCGGKVAAPLPACAPRENHRPTPRRGCGGDYGTQLKVTALCSAAVTHRHGRQLQQPQHLPFQAVGQFM